jgi:hypothetical protein
MKLSPLPFSAPLERYRGQAEALRAAHGTGDPEAIALIHRKHPRFLDEKIPWLPRDLPEGAVRNAAFDAADAELTLARWYDYLDWPSLAGHVEAICRREEPLYAFEAAADAIAAGDAAALRALLRDNPGLAAVRSARVTHFDPPVHGCQLLHYIGANGVEQHRQRTPPNAVEIARMLLDAGAEPDALAWLYGGECTTLSLLVSSSHPAEAGLQAELAETLLDYGASVEPRGSGNWQSPLMTALAFGYRETAEALVRRGARVDTLPAAAALGRLDLAANLLGGAGPPDRHRALALAAQHGHVEVVRLLLDAGEDPNRYNPEGSHAHSTPLHQAALGGHEGVVRLLAKRGARLDMQDTIYHGTPLGWALHGGRDEVAQLLRRLTS